MPIMSYNQEFERINTISNDYQEGNNLVKNLDKLTTIINSNTLDIPRTMKCAKVFLNLFPDETEISKYYLYVLDKSIKLSKDYLNLFGENLEKLAYLKDTIDLYTQNRELKDNIESLSNAINKVYDKKIGDIKSVRAKYNGIVDHGIIKEEDYPQYKRIINNYSIFIESFKTISEGIKYIEKNGPIEDIIEDSKRLRDEYIDIIDEINELSSRAPTLSPGASELIEKLSGRRVLLRDLDLDFLAEIKEKRPDLHTKIFVKIME